jgi:methionyl aminopeptidase
MVDIKTKEEIEIMARGGKILSDVLHKVVESIEPGMTEIEVDAMADKLIKEAGAEAGFKKVKGYRHATCMATNNVVVHGIPTDYIFKEGDIVGVDCGVFLEGFNTDMSHSVIVGKKKDPELVKFLETGEKALNEAIKVAVGGNRIGNISKTIQDIVEGEGYSIVRSLIGHGVGRTLHEEPEVPGFLTGKIEKTPILKPGMTIAVEVIYNMGESDVSYLNNDGWTIATSDGSLSGLFERTIAITEEEPLILTK